MPTVCIPIWWIQVAAGVLAIFLVFKLAFPISLYIAAQASGAPVRATELIGMRLRRVDPRKVVEPYIGATKAGLAVDLAALEGHYLAGGNVADLVEDLIRVDRSGVPWTFEQMAAEQLRSRSRH